MKFNSDEERVCSSLKWNSEHSNVASIKGGIGVDYIAAKGAIDELLEIYLIRNIGVQKLRMI